MIRLLFYRLFKVKTRGLLTLLLVEAKYITHARGSLCPSILPPSPTWPPKLPVCHPPILPGTPCNVSHHLPYARGSLCPPFPPLPGSSIIRLCLGLCVPHFPLPTPCPQHPSSVPALRRLYQHSYVGITCSIDTAYADRRSFSVNIGTPLPQRMLGTLRGAFFCPLRVYLHDKHSSAAATPV